MPQIVSWTGSFHSANVCWLSVTWYHYWISHKYDYHHPSSPPMGPNKYISYLRTHVCDLDSYPGHQKILNLHVTCSEAMGHLLPHTDHAYRIMMSWAGMEFKSLNYGFGMGVDQTHTHRPQVSYCLLSCSVVLLGWGHPEGELGWLT